MEVHLIDNGIIYSVHPYRTQNQEEEEEIIVPLNPPELTFIDSRRALSRRIRRAFASLR
jgi:hypothetical protein